jgi:hypothetical protein
MTHPFLCIVRQRLRELYFVLRRVVHTEITVPPGLAHDLLRQMRAALLELISTGQFHDNPETELLFVVFDGLSQIRNRDLGCNPG